MIPGPRAFPRVELSSGSCLFPETRKIRRNTAALMLVRGGHLYVANAKLQNEFKSYLCCIIDACRELGYPSLKDFMVASY